MGTVIVSIVLVLIVALVIWKMVSDKKKGKNSCGCECGSCALRDKCHDIQKQKEYFQNKTPS